MKAFKRIFCIALGLLITLSSLTTFFAAEEPSYAEIKNKFFEYCMDNMVMITGGENEVEITDRVAFENGVVFSADSWEGPYSGLTEIIAGDWYITASELHYPYDLGVYVYYEENVLSLEKAVCEGVISDLSVINNFFGITAEKLDDLTKKCVDAFKIYQNFTPNKTENIECKVFGEIGEYAVFRAYINDRHSDYPAMNSKQVIGNYSYTYSRIAGPEENPTGLFVLTPDGTVISALEAYNQNLITDKELADIANGTPYHKYDPYNQYKYEEIIIPKVMEENIFEESTEITSYREIYEYYSDASTADEATPDYVLIDLSTNLYYAMPVADILGDLLLAASSGNIPFTYGYAVYIPETGDIYDLTYALTLDIEGIENTLSHIGFIARMGDTDCDRKLTIKDATYLQKCLAGLEEFREDDDITGYFFESEKSVYISDYNRDGERNIRDATAIQKKLAKIEL